MREVVLLGAAGTAADVLAWLPEVGVACRGLLDDDPKKAGATLGGARVLGPLALARDLRHVEFVDAMGSPRSYGRRRASVEGLGLDPARFATLVGPQTFRAASARLGRAVTVYPQCFVGADVRLGDHVTVLSGCKVNHDASVGAWSILATGAIVSGGVEVGDGCYVGAGAVLRDGVRVGAGSLVGMGAVVTKDVPPGVVVAGNPARLLRKAGPP